LEPGDTDIAPVVLLIGFKLINLGF